MTRFSVEVAVEATLLKTVVVEAASMEDAANHAKAFHDAGMEETEDPNCYLHESEAIENCGKDSFLGLRIYDKQGITALYEEDTMGRIE